MTLSAAKSTPRSVLRWTIRSATSIVTVKIAAGVATEREMAILDGGESSADRARGAVKRSTS